MTRSDSDRVERGENPAAIPIPHAKRSLRRWLLYGGTAIVLGSALFWILIPAAKIPVSPPEVDLTSASAPLRDLITNAREAVIRVPGSANHWGRLGMILLANERDVDAVLCFQQAAALNPGDFRWHYYLGLTSTALNRDLAISALTKACGIQANDPMAHSRLGELLLATGNVSESGSHLEQAVRHSRNPDPRPLQALARVRLLEGKITEARQLADEAYRLAPDSRMVLEVLARILDRQGEKEIVQKLLQEIESLPDQSLPWMDPYAEQALAFRFDASRIENAARTLAENGDSQGAIQLLSTELKKSPNNISLRLTLSQIYVQGQRFEDALGVLNAAQASAPQNAEVRFRIGVVKYFQKDIPQAAESFRQTLQLKPDYALALYNLAQCCLQLGDQRGAIDAFEATLRISPDQNLARFHLAKLLIEQQRPAEAREHLRKVLDSSPDNADARELLRQIDLQSKPGESLGLPQK